MSILDYKIKTEPWWLEGGKEIDVEAGVSSFQNGGELVNIELSETPSVIPEGALHKDKHDDFGIDVTKKGIPVITVKDDNVSTLEEIQEQKDSVIQHAEIEHNEIIFSKELTDFIEDHRKKWHADKDDQILIDLGKRITKEILENTDDNTNLIEKIENKL